NRRLLVSDCHIPECICRMARPIVFWAQTDAALLVLTLVVVAERIASSFSRFIKPASRKNTPRRFYAHQQRSNCDRHMYGIRTRFIPDTITEHFEQCTWPVAREDGSAPRAPIKPVDLTARIKSRWQ